MRRHAKAADAGSTKRRAKTNPALLACALAACVAALALVVGSASGSTTRFLQETFGSSAQPSFPADRGIAVDQSTNEVYVLDATEDTLYRFNSDGSASNFSALGSNAIDGEGSGDETPQVGLSIPSSRKESQIAIDESGTATDGDIYVAGGSAHRIDIFSSEGEYKGQLTEYSGGALGETCGVAVDGSGNVYVGDNSHGVHVYEPAANPPVNGDNTATYTTAANPCTLAAGSGATAGFLFVDRFNGELKKLDAATGEVKYTLATGASTVSVDPTTGHVFSARNTGGSSTIDEYDASGATEASLVSSFKPGSTAEGVAANGASKEVYVSRSGTENVEVYGGAAIVPDVTTEAPSSNTGMRATLAGTVNPDGVELDECFFEWGQGSGSTEYTETTPCAETPGEIGAGSTPVGVHADLSGLTPQGKGYHYRLVAVNPNATISGSNQNFTTPTTVTPEAVTGITATEATLNGTVNPDTATLSECLLEWGPEKTPVEAFQAFPETAPCVPGPGGITGESPVAVHADMSGLHPGTTYVYRFRVGYPSATITNPTVDQPPLSLQTTGPVIAASWAQAITRTEASLRAQINPEGLATTYHFEYGKTTAYGSKTEELNVGSDSSLHPVSRFLTGLSPDTTYHYRLVVTDGVVTNEGPDHTLTTFAPFAANTGCANQAVRYGPSAKLPDCRAYEMVTPVDKGGEDIIGPPEVATPVRNGYEQAASFGDKIAYSSGASFGGQVSSVNSNQYLATRTPDGWSTDAINGPSGPNIYFPNPPFGPYAAIFTPFTWFNNDLTKAWQFSEVALTPNEMNGELHLYRQDLETHSFEGLASAPAIPDENNLEFSGTSEDGRHQVLYASERIYDVVDGESHMVSILPDGSPAVGRVGDYNFGQLGRRQNQLDRAISADGSRIFWTTGGHSIFGAIGKIYVRLNPDKEQSALSGEECIEPAKACTIPVSESVTLANARFWTARTDGAKAVFSVGSPGNADLYKFDLESGTSDLIASGVYGVAGAGANLADVYFVSKEALDAGASAGRPNLYLDHEGTTTFVAALPASEVSTAPENPSVINPSPFNRVSRVSASGRRLAFMSTASLTGYDNLTVNGGVPAYEVFFYDADKNKLTCVSCNPTGARPSGGEYRRPYAAITKEQIPTGRTAAAWIPTWEHETYGSRVLSQSADRLYFNSFDALVPEDTNGVQDVYQWEADGSGSCRTPGGCIDLISGGENAAQSEFVDASVDGNDVFIRTESSFDPRDQGLLDIYDARSGGGYPIPAAPPECIGDACQSVPDPPRDATPASAVFRGAGNSNAPGIGNCRRGARKASKLARRAKRWRRFSAHSNFPAKSRAARRRATRLESKAKRLRRRSARCRRAARRRSR